ncbi:MAG: tripartite tricarboxylate transporter substrate-binding protein, partial [Alphaproteobacteria bacterium]
MKNKFETILKGSLATLVGAAFALTANVALADYPEKDITFIVPYSPGGGSDQMARRLQPGLEKALGVNVRIVYKTGGGGAVGFSELHRSKPDGYTISNVVVPNVILSSKGDGVGYKPDDFEYIGMTESA